MGSSYFANLRVAWLWLLAFAGERIVFLSVVRTDAALNYAILLIKSFSCPYRNDEFPFFLSGDGGYARDARLKAPSSLAVAPNGTLYIADLGNIRIRAVSPNQPQPSPAGLVEISSPLDQELYLFSQVLITMPNVCICM